MSHVAAVAFALFLAIAVGLVAACRTWARAADVEQAEAALRAEFDRLEDE